MQSKSLYFIFAFLCAFSFSALAAPAPAPTHHSVQSVVNEIAPIHKDWQHAQNDHQERKNAWYDRHPEHHYPHPGPAPPHQLLGGGMSGSVYALRHPVRGPPHDPGPHNAVVKVIDNGVGNIQHEAHALQHVNQFLGWGHDKSHGRDTHYIVQKNMGVHADQTGKHPHVLNALNRQADARYEHDYGLRNGDPGPNNYAYHRNTPNGKLQAEVIDWGRAHGTPRHPSYPPQPIPVAAPHSSGRHCPGCTMQ